METQNEFVAKRLAAHKAVCADTAADPLVTMAFADKAVAAAVIARWPTLRAQATPEHAPFTEYLYNGGVRRQAE